MAPHRVTRTDPRPTAAGSLELPTEEQRGIHGQNIVNVILLTSGLSNERINHNAEEMN